MSLSYLNFIDPVICVTDIKILANVKNSLSEKLFSFSF